MIRAIIALALVIASTAAVADDSALSACLAKVSRWKRGCIDSGKYLVKQCEQRADRLADECLDRQAVARNRKAEAEAEMDKIFRERRPEWQECVDKLGMSAAWNDREKICKGVANTKGGDATCRNVLSRAMDLAQIECNTRIRDEYHGKKSVSDVAYNRCVLKLKGKKMVMPADMERCEQAGDTAEAKDYDVIRKRILNEAKKQAVGA